MTTQGEAVSDEEALYVALNSADVEDDIIDAAWREVERLRAAAATHKRVQAVIEKWEYRPPTSLIEEVRNALDGAE